MLTCKFQGPLRAAGLAFSVAALGLFVVGCEKVPLLAPTGSTITLTASTTALSANGSTSIKAQVLEATGTPPHSGTQVTFTTTLGRIEPSEITTDVSGIATVTFVAGGANGTATIGALSGGATTGTTGAIKIAVGTAAVGKVFLNASTLTVPATGGSATIAATVIDVNGNPLASTPVSFTTTAGTLSSTLVSTDGNGGASVVLTTSQQATVTASVGISGTTSGSVVINVASAPTILITPPSTAPSKGLPAIFTFVVTPASQNGSAIRSVVVNWGDGDVQNLGTFTGSQTQSHVFRRDDVFLVSATVTDANGGSNTTSTSVVVIPVPQPGISITVSGTQQVGFTITFSIQISVPAGISVTNTKISYGDGKSDGLGGGTSPRAQHKYTVADTYPVEVSVTDTTGTTTVGTTQVTIAP